MFLNFKNKIENFYKNTNIPIMMITGSQDEIFNPGELKESYNLISSNSKHLIILEDKTHTSIIWSAGLHINGWLEDLFYIP